MTDAEMKDKAELLLALSMLEDLSYKQPYNQNFLFPLMPRVKQKIANLRSEITNALEPNKAFEERTPDSFQQNLKQ